MVWGAFSVHKFNAKRSIPFRIPRIYLLSEILRLMHGWQIRHLWRRRWNQEWSEQPSELQLSMPSSPSHGHKTLTNIKKRKRIDETKRDVNAHLAANFGVLFFTLKRRTDINRHNSSNLSIFCAGIFEFKHLNYFRFSQEQAGKSARLCVTWRICACESYYGLTSGSFHVLIVGMRSGWRPEIQIWFCRLAVYAITHGSSSSLTPRLWSSIVFVFSIL